MGKTIHERKDLYDCAKQKGFDMKTKFIIDVEKKGGELEVTYLRRDLKPAQEKEDKLILLYIESLLRSTIDGGFAPGKKREENGESVGERKEVSDN